MVGILNRVGCVIVDSGTGDVTADTAISNTFNLPGDAGAVNSSAYYWALEKGTDVEVFAGVWTSATKKVSRTTTLFSRIGGVWGTTHVPLDPATATATLKSCIPAEAFLGFLTTAGGTFTGAVVLAADPANPLEAATKQYVDTKANNLAKKFASVRAATTANLTISTLTNGSTLDGVTLATGDTVLVKDQTTASQNGVYVVGASPARDTLFDTWNEHPGALVTVQEGTVNADTTRLCTADNGGTLGTTSITWAPTPPLNAATLAVVVHAATGKTTPVDADEFPLADSAASFGLKKLTLANLKAAFKATTAQFLANVTGLFLTTDQVWAAGTPLALTLKANATVTMTIASPGVVTDTAHAFTGNEPVHYTNSGGALPTGVTASTELYVLAAGLTTSTYQLSLTPGGAAINTSGSQSGTHTREARLLLDGNAASFFTLTPNRNFTLAKPRNWKASQGGRLTVTQDGTGSRTMTYGNQAAGGWGIAGTTAITLSTAASAKDKLFIDAESATDVVLSIAKAIA